MCKMNLENLIIPESQDATNDHRGVSKGHRRQAEESPVLQGHKIQCLI